jgi:hypothetical protein
VMLLHKIFEFLWKTDTTRNSGIDWFRSRFRRVSDPLFIQLPNLSS